LKQTPVAGIRPVQNRQRLELRNTLPSVALLEKATEQLKRNIPRPTLAGSQPHCQRHAV
jgi:hypothetical protein